MHCYWKDQNFLPSFKRLFNCFRFRTIKRINHVVQKEILPVITMTELFSSRRERKEDKWTRAYRMCGLPPTLFSWQQWVMRCYRVKQSYRKSCPNNLWHWITTPSSGDNSCHQWMFRNMDFLQNTIFNR